MKQYVTDCEGPVSLNDNAMELAAAFIPNGEDFFVKLSRYDDYLADMVKRPGYKAGDTLRLIIPFFKAYGVSAVMMEDFSRSHVMLVPGAAKVLREIAAAMNTFIISTSYSPYIEALCGELGFPFENTYCTAIDIDRYVLDARETDWLRAVKEEIDALPAYDLPATGQLADLSADARKVVGRFETLFWHEMKGTQAGALLTAVNPVGGAGKARALAASVERTGAAVTDVLYVGDSITDVQAFESVKQGGGLAVSFNGNRYAIEAADIAVYGEDAAILGMIAAAFVAGGKDNVKVLLRGLSINIMNEIKLRGAHVMTGADREKIIRESEAVRRSIRGVAGQVG